jgi:polysaccharide biosynthesis protein PslH
MLTILTIIPYKFYPPKGGGALRCYYLIRELSRIHKVFIITDQPIEDFTFQQEYVLSKNVNIISTHGEKKWHSFLNKLLPESIANSLNSRFLRRSINEPANSYFLDVYPVLVKLLKNNSFDVVLFESLEVVNFFSPVTLKLNKTALHIYDAHNVDSELWLQQASEKHPKYFNYAKKALQIEKKLYNKVNIFICCSELDKEKLYKLNRGRIRGYCVPNGVDVISRPFDSNPKKNLIRNIIFCGNLDYLPNKEGLLWFYNNVYPFLKFKVTNIKLLVIGTCTDMNDYSELVEDSSIIFKGTVESVVPFYLETSVAIVPLLSGSGTRLKVLEGMSMGNPLVTTYVGVEGIDCVSGKEILIANEPKEFALQVLKLLEDKTKFENQRVQAYKFVQKAYDWKVIGKNLNHIIKSNLKPNLLIGNLVL